MSDASKAVLFASFGLLYGAIVLLIPTMMDVHAIIGPAIGYALAKYDNRTKRLEERKKRFDDIASCEEYDICYMCGQNIAGLTKEVVKDEVGYTNAR